MSAAWRMQGPARGAVARLAGALEDESDRWFLWIPVCFGTGAGLYLSLTEEPSGLAVAAGLAIAAVLHGLSRRTALIAAVALSAAALWIALGFADAKLRTSMVATPTLSHATGIITLKGWVERAELRTGSRYRLTLSVIDMAPKPAGERPALVRVTVTSKAPPPGSGQAVVMRARLMPLPEPVEPGGFDFARKAWFAGLGAVGYALGPPRILQHPPPMPTNLWFSTRLDRWRRAIGGRIRTALPNETGALAVALITGERGTIAPSTLDALRHSGLAHVLAISGMHMAMIAGALFWLVRALLAAVPPLALQYPIKKWAALVALCGAAFYLVLSGASLATERAFVMIAILFAAILLDRPALTLRNVAIAAILILALFPESVVDVSFQMSFAAVVALVAVYEASARRAFKAYPSALWARAGYGALRYMGALALTTLVASIAVAPFAAYHFHALAQYGLLANLLAMPVFGILVMPMALASLLAMPFGLEAWPLAAMGYGLERVVAVAAWVSSLEGAVIHVAAMPVSALVLVSIGGLWLSLWRGPVRTLGLAVAALGLIVAMGGVRPDVLIGRDGAQIAIRHSDGRLRVPSRSRDSYALEHWLLADGDETRPGKAVGADFYSCDELACLAEIKGLTVAFIRHPAAIAEECARADVVISQIPLRGPCANARVIVDRGDLAKEGAHALFLSGGSIRKLSAARLRGARPWVKPGPPPAKREAAGRAHAADFD